MGTAWALATSRTRQPTQRGSRARRRLRLATKPAPWGIAEADNKAGAIELLDHDDADVVVLDIQMPVEKGLNTIAGRRGRSPRLRIVVCSFHQEAATKERALAHGADAYTSTNLWGADRPEARSPATV